MNLWRFVLGFTVFTRIYKLVLIEFNQNKLDCVFVLRYRNLTEIIQNSHPLVKIFVLINSLMKNIVINGMHKDVHIEDSAIY